MAALVLKPSSVIHLPSFIYKSTICSRIFLFGLQVVFNHLIPDHQSDAFQSPYKLIPSNATTLDSAIDFSFGGLARWDGQYFLHIATLGYTHENCFAFFPLFPMVVKLASQAINFISSHNLNNWNAALLSSFVINTTMFTKAAVYLYKITYRVTGSQRFAFRTWQFFCLSPATIFFLSPYSESLFCALTFGGMYHCLEGKFSKAVILFGLSTASRSNGLLNISIILFYILLSVNRISFLELTKKAYQAALSVFLISIPFLLYQLHVYRSLCFQYEPIWSLPETVKKYLVSEKLTIPGRQISQWCYNVIPLSYSAIQSSYWNNGFLHYFQWKQIPNFILALPILVLTTLYFWTFVQRNYRTVFTAQRFKANYKSPIFRLDCAIFALHSMFLALFTFFFAHVQIATRLIGSSSPVAYWTMAWLFHSNSDTSSVPWILVWNPCFNLRKSVTAKLLCCYCLSYAIIGTFMFVNHLPWT